MRENYRIGVFRNAGSGWHGGQIYFDNLIALLREKFAEPVDLVIIEKERGASGVDDENSVIPTVFFNEYRERKREEARDLRKEAKRNEARKKRWSGFFPGKKVKDAPQLGEGPPERAAFADIANEYELDFVFPLPAMVGGFDVKGAGWIPDLQHCFLPDLFDPAEIETRDEAFRKLSEGGIIVFSSKTSRDEFRERFPGSAAQLEVWSFCSNPASTLFAADPLSVARQYRLPERFFVVANQFWKHKDHAIVIEALIKLKSEGLSVPVVFTGALRDYRGTGHVDQILQSIQRGGIHDSVHMLGFLDREEQLHLMRAAVALIQPSRFEGWSTVVEDCKAIGQRLILSDLPVHREQSPSDSVYFPVGDPVELAGRIRAFFEIDASDWINEREAREVRARSESEQARILARERFLEIVELSQAVGAPTDQARIF